MNIMTQKLNKKQSKSKKWKEKLKKKKLNNFKILKINNNNMSKECNGIIDEKKYEIVKQNLTIKQHFMKDIERLLNKSTSTNGNTDEDYYEILKDPMIIQNLKCVDKKIGSKFKSSYTIGTKPESEIIDHTSTNNQHSLTRHENDLISSVINSTDDSDITKEQLLNQQVSLKRKRSLNNSNDNEDENEQLKKKLQTTPWIKGISHHSRLEITDWLTYEIKNFVHYISPTKSEIDNRNDAFNRVKDCIESFWNDCNVLMFGSFTTNLYLPTSDMDLVVISSNNNLNEKYNNIQLIYSLSSYLKKIKISLKIEVIKKAKIPILKFKELKSNLNFDISFENKSGLITSNTINNWISQTSGLFEITLLIKYLISIKKFNIVKDGGIGGFSITCLVYSFLKLHPKIQTNSINIENNLGVLLIEFLEFYGNVFPYEKIGINILKNGNCNYIIKKNSYIECLERGFLIIDPNDPTNNISKATHAVGRITKAFSIAFKRLTERCLELNNATYKDRIGESILSSIIKIKGQPREFVINE